MNADDSVRTRSVVNHYTPHLDISLLLRVMGASEISATDTNNSSKTTVQGNSVNTPTDSQSKGAPKNATLSSATQHQDTDDSEDEQYEHHQQVAASVAMAQARH